MTTITVTHAELSRLVSIVAPSVEKPANSLPLLSSVRFGSFEGKIEASGTDRYTFAIARGAAEVPEGLTFNVKLTDLRHLLAITKPVRRSSVTLTLDVLEDAIFVSTANRAAEVVEKVEPDLNRIGRTKTVREITREAETLGAGQEITVSYPLEPGEFPRLDVFLKSVTEDGERPDLGPIAFNPELLRRIPGVGRGEAAIFRTPSSKRASGQFEPAAFFGPDWAVVIMPMRASVQQDADAYPKQWFPK